MLKKIPGNVEKDSGECSRRFREIFRKISEDAFSNNRKIKHNDISISFEIQIEKKSLRPWEKAKKERLKAKTNRRRK